jgi:hypothetical protein
MISRFVLITSQLIGQRLINGIFTKHASAVPYNVVFEGDVLMTSSLHGSATSESALGG